MFAVRPAEDDLALEVVDTLIFENDLVVPVSVVYTACCRRSTSRCSKAESADKAAFKGQGRGLAVRAHFGQLDFSNEVAWMFAQNVEANDRRAVADAMDVF